MERKFVDVFYDSVKNDVILTFNAYSPSKPDESACFWLTGPYCELWRSPRERIVFKIPNASTYALLRQTKRVQVIEKSDSDKDRTWSYGASQKKDNRSEAH